MRTAILIFALLGLAICSIEVTSTQIDVPSTQADVCLKTLKVTTHEALTSVSNGLGKNWLDMTKHLFETGADAIQNYEDCSKIKPKDLLAWLMFNTSQKTQTCIMLAVSVLVDFHTAIKSKQINDIITAVSSLDQTNELCMLE